MMIRKERAEFLDNLLKVFNDVRVLRKKDLEIQFKNDTYLLVQTEKHLKILEKDGMIRCSVLNEYFLEPAGRKVLDDIENLGYLANHKKEAAKWEEFEDEDGGDWDWVRVDILLSSLHLLRLAN
ncbi:MAG TPA: hypothetical protein VF144_19125 [Chitinophagaceae bacterium]